MDTDLAALAHYWQVWARPKQLPPARAWKSFGFITGRGFGKTRSNVELVLDEVLNGGVRNVGFAAQDLDTAERVMMHGPDGLLTRAPPWFRPEVVKGQVIFPNGAVATPLTPQVPNGPRNWSFDFVWLAEIAAWPASTRDEFMSNIRYALRLGAARMAFDTTPKARNPLVRYLIDRAKRDPQRHVLVRGSTRENADNLTDDFVTDLEADYGGTQKAREEMDGEFFDDNDGALWKQEWIERARRDMPTVLRRRVLSVDPTISTRKGTDRTGLVELGLGVDDQVFVIADHTDRYAAEEWGALLIRLYFEGHCDCVIVERNRGGDLVVANIRACARERGLRVEVVEADAVTRHVPGTIYVKEVISRKGKDLRAEPVASLYERGRVSHVRGADLADLEELMCTWDPSGGGPSPDALDALVHGAWELAALSRVGGGREDGARAIEGAVKLQEAMTRAPERGTGNVAALLSGRGDWGGGDRI